MYLPPLDPKVVPKSVGLMNATTLWPPTPQNSATELARTVRINNIGPILDQDILIPHPTQFTTHQCMYYTGIPKVCSPHHHWCV